MPSIVLVAIGGALGSVLRYLLVSSAHQLLSGWRFPIGTFLVNVLGCLAIGGFAALAQRGGFLSADMRLFLMTGLAGGFTTFSAFGLETFELLRRAEWAIAGSYVLASLVVGMSALALGFALLAQKT